MNSYLSTKSGVNLTVSETTDACGTTFCSSQAELENAPETLSIYILYKYRYSKHLIRAIIDYNNYGNGTTE